MKMWLDWVFKKNSKLAWKTKSTGLVIFMIIEIAAQVYERFACKLTMKIYWVKAQVLHENRQIVT